MLSEEGTGCLLYHPLCFGLMKAGCAEGWGRVRVRVRADEPMGAKPLPFCGHQCQDSCHVWAFFHLMSLWASPTPQYGFPSSSCMSIWKANLSFSLISPRGDPNTQLPHHQVMGCGHLTETAASSPCLSCHQELSRMAGWLLFLKELLFPFSTASQKVSQMLFTCIRWSLPPRVHVKGFSLPFPFWPGTHPSSVSRSPPSSCLLGTRLFHRPASSLGGFSAKYVQRSWEREWEH